ncbi:MAG: hypothetical protein FJZ56_01145 [Chlamydiae bacterium]|nr:hypothetical protein [Chlamydiota bacterium]
MSSIGSLYGYQDVKIYSPFMNNIGDMVLGKEVREEYREYREILTSRDLTTEKSICFRLDPSFFQNITASKFMEDSVSGARSVLYNALYARGLLDVNVDSYQLGSFLAELVFGSYSPFITNMTVNQRRNHLPKLLFEEFHFDIQCFKEVLSWYVFSSADRWNSLSYEEIQKRYKAIQEGENWHSHSSNKVVCYEEFFMMKLTQKVWISKNVVHSLLHGLVDEAVEEKLIEEISVDFGVDGQEFGRAIAEILWNQPEKSKRTIALILLGLPLLISKKFFVESMISYYFEKRQIQLEGIGASRFREI